jgi:hypothetical protein
MNRGDFAVSIVRMQSSFASSCESGVEAVQDLKEIRSWDKLYESIRRVRSLFLTSVVAGNVADNTQVA